MTGIPGTVGAGGTVMPSFFVMSVVHHVRDSGPRCTAVKTMLDRIAALIAALSAVAATRRRVAACSKNSSIAAVAPS